MKGKWRSLDRFRRILLLLLALMALGFAVVYFIAFDKQGIELANAFLVQAEENGATLYSGQVREKETVFTVTQTGAVTLRVGDNTFGPYTVEEDDAVSFADQPGDRGIVLYDKGEQIFRGVYRASGGYFTLLDAPGRGWGRVPFFAASTESNYGDPDWEPPFDLIVRMALGDAPVGLPSVRQVYILGLVISVLAAISMLWAERLFRFRTRFRIKDTDKAEPSAWYLWSRAFLWGLMTLMALFCYTSGLKMASIGGYLS